MDANAETERSLDSFVKEESYNLPFAVVYGEEGVGKTTLVQKVYNNPEVRHKFKGCAWITVTPQLQHNTILKDILSQINYQKKESPAETQRQRLVTTIKSALLSNKYLIVLDLNGIFSKDDNLLENMPTGKMPSKVVITTRNKEDTKNFVGDERGLYLKMSPLTEAQSLELFQTQSDRQSSGTKRDHVAIRIAHASVNDDEKKLTEMRRKCEGVPLAVKLLANLVARNGIRTVWNELRQQSCVSVQDLLEVSYSLLPKHLKTCLHYLALFPKDKVDIEADKLCNLWIADKMTTTLKQAETYLKELANLGLVEVEEEETPTPTKIKSCSLPHYVRNFFRSGKAKEESLFATQDLRPICSSSEETYMPQVNMLALAFYFDEPVAGGYDFQLSPKKTYEKVRSILFLNTRQQDRHLLRPKSVDLRNCKLLRALDFNWLDFRRTKFHGINNLDHLRYLSFRDCYLEKLPPASIQNLKSLETLDLRVNDKVTFEMSKSDVCQLTRLRSLYLPYKFETSGDKKLELDRLSELENLQNFVSSRCRANDLSKLEKLRYLAATIATVEDLEEVTNKCLSDLLASIHLEIIDFRSPRGASALSDLLACRSLNALHLHGQIGSWPISHKLTEIFLIASELKEDPMPNLGNLPLLQKLGLSNSAFVGVKITCKESGFPQLRYLKLSNLPDLRSWDLEETAMRKLSTLTIENCKNLKTLPEGLTTRRHLKINRM